MQHLLPAFTVENEPVFLLHVPKADPKLTKGLRTLEPEEEITPERAVKAWCVSHAHADATRKVVEGIYEGTTWCERCASGVPCDVWDEGKLSFNDFEPRIPEVMERKEWDKLLDDTLAGFYSEGVAYMGDAACDFIGVKRSSQEGKFVKEGARIATDFASTILGSIFGPQVRQEQDRRQQQQQQPWMPPVQQGMSKAEARAVLGVSEQTDEKGIKRAYVIALLKAHPDKGGSEDAVKRVISAKVILLGK